ncbi:hypothetical protein LIER_37179 [Lithospermum erythrorhizon]|uniref:Cation efflux protein transmembrane domain-containing protein n=1 Tax=Lithospermum erythrorhizon TaxID=34254 RepID=A0AAV3PGI0_LITER
MILAELSGNVAAKFVTLGRKRDFEGFSKIGFGKIRGFFGLFFGLFMLSVSWDRAECFPFSSINVRRFGFSVFPGGENCVRVWPMLLPFMSGFLGSYERVFMNPGSIRELGRKRVRLVTLFFTTVVLFVPAVVSMFVFEAEGDSISVMSLGWPLANTVVFGVLLSENLADEKLSDSKDFQREYVVTFLCTLVLELFYFPELSLWGLLIAGLLLWIAMRELDPLYSDYVQLGLESSESVIMKPLRHILSERKSRKIALFLLINTAYMVVEFAAGFMSNSLGLISDACHMLFDCAALAIGLYASYISRLPANAQFNYGRGRFEVLSGYVNAVFLVLVGALIVLESMERILDPQEISTNSLLSVSIGGFLVNLVGLIFFHEEHHHAHGGPGSCSHSHSHSHSNHHHHHHHADVNKNNESVTVFYDNDEKTSSSHDQQYTGGDNVHHDTCEGHKSGNEGGCNHNNEHQHAHHNHSHHDHNNGHQHDHHNHSHQDDHHDHHHDRLHHHDVVHRGHGGNSENSYIQTPGVSLEVHKGHLRHESGNDHSEQVLDGKENLEQGHHHRHIDHNMEGIFLHVLADTLGSVGVVISTLLIKYKGWLVADPACSIFISILIVSSVIPLLCNSAGILLQRVPRAHEQDLRDALKNIMKLKGVCGIQNFHVWSLTNTDVVGTLHLHLSAETDKDFVKSQVLHLLAGAGIKDLTIHVEHILSS